MSDPAESEPGIRHSELVVLEPPAGWQFLNFGEFVVFP